MEFLNPYAFLFLIIIPVLWFLKNLKLPFKKEILEKILITDGISRKKRFMLYLFSFVLIITALARPVNGIQIKNIKTNKSNIIIILSGGYKMSQKDIYPDRFDAAVEKLKTLFKHLKYQNIALLIAKKHPYMISPFTNDYTSIIYLLKHINKKELFNTNADFEKAFKAAKKLSKKAIIITVASKPQNYGISYVISTNKYPNRINFTYSSKDINELLQRIKKHSNIKTVKIRQTKELFYIPLFLGIIFFFIASFSFRRNK